MQRNPALRKPRVPAPLHSCTQGPRRTVFSTVLVATSTRCVMSPIVTNGSLLSARMASSSLLLVYTSFHSPLSADIICAARCVCAAGGALRGRRAGRGDSRHGPFYGASAA